MPQHQTSNRKLPITLPSVKTTSDLSDLGLAAGAFPPPGAPPGGERSGFCNHDGPLQCSICNALMIGAELCADPKVHSCATRPTSNVQELVGHDGAKVTYRTDWPRDPEGYALVTITNSHTEDSVTLPCIAPWIDEVTGRRFPFRGRDPKYPGWLIQVLSGLSPNQWKERAAHLPGRDAAEHERKYLCEEFFRDYYWHALHRAGRWQPRSVRRRKIKNAHRENDCTDPCCRKRHR